ncbi:MAG: hypothetical protein HQM03_13290 [Magnetococcales bacterium]|nr:hypothetical protein [Magnetococcales bacterium]
MSSAEFLIRPDVHIPEFLIRDVVAKLAYVDEAVAQVSVAADGALRLQLQGEPPDAAREGEIRRKVQRAIGILVATTREPMIRVSEDCMDRPLSCATDPMPGLLASGEVVRTGDGVYALGPLVAGLCRFFENRLFALGLAHGGRIHRFPGMIPAEFLEKIQYFKNFPHSLNFVSHLREDLDLIERFASETHCRDGLLQTPPQAFSQVRHLLSPTVCHNYYLFLANRRLTEDPTAATAQGSCYRYESINMQTLERLWNFSMWEVIFVGSAPRVKEALVNAGREASRLLQEWGLAYRVENATDPFFIREFGMQAGFQNIHDLKHEYRARLPFKEGTLAVGSRNYHMDFFGRHMAITLENGAPAHSGCMGFGLERLAFALLAQYGNDPLLWPEPVRSGVRHGP